MRYFALLIVLFLSGCSVFEPLGKNVVEAARREAESRGVAYRGFYSITYCDSPEEIEKKCGGAPARVVKNGRTYYVAGRCNFATRSLYVLVGPDEDETLGHELGHWLLESSDEDAADEFAEAVLRRME